MPWSHFQDATISIAHESPMNILRSIGHIASDDNYEEDEYLKFEVAGLGHNSNEHCHLR